VPARARLALMVFASLALLGALGFVLLYQPGGAARGGTGFEGAEKPAIPPQDFTLRDEQGERVRLSDYRGQPVLVTFLYTTCEDTCPITAQQIKLALDDLGHDVPALAVSVDPAKDTEQRARRFLVRQGLTGRMRFLLGSRPELERVWKAYGIQPQGEGFEHTAHVLVVDARGRQRVGWPVDKLTPEGLAHDLRLLDAT
jgi:protein SCO1/2